MRLFHNRKRQFTLSKFVLISLIIFVIMYVAGFVFFIYKTPLNNSDSMKKLLPNSADSIVVFTGEGVRIVEGLKLYHDEKVAPKLFISGVWKNLPIDYFFKLSKNKNAKNQLEILNKNGIDYDNYATNTTENVESLKSYIDKNHMKKVVVVSSFYHIPRIRYLMRKNFSNVDIIFYPVFPNAIPTKLSSRKFCKIMFLEYNKTIVYIAWNILGVESINKDVKIDEKVNK